jgi:hypothetical protein
MEQAYKATEETQEFCARGSRLNKVEFMAAFFEAQKFLGTSVLQFAQERDLPEATVRHWVTRAPRAAEVSSRPTFVEFAESPEGLRVSAGHHPLCAPQATRLCLPRAGHRLPNAAAT